MDFYSQGLCKALYKTGSTHNGSNLKRIQLKGFIRGGNNKNISANMCFIKHISAIYVLYKVAHGRQGDDGYIENKHGTDVGDTGIQGLESLCQICNAEHSLQDQHVRHNFLNYN